MRKLLVLLLLLLGVLLAGILVAPSFVDWNSQRGWLVAQIKALTGRDLTIAGDVRLALLPAPALSAEQVSLASLPGGSAAEMARVQRLDLRIALLPLLRGEIQVESLILIEPEILLEILPDGRRNWDLSPADAISGSGAGQEQADSGGVPSGAAMATPQIQLNQVTLRNGRIIYRDDLGEERVEALNADISAASLRGPFSFVGSAELGASRLEFDAKLGRMPSTGSAPLNMMLELPETDTALRFNGAVSDAPDNIILKGRLRLSGSNLLATANEFLGTAASVWRLPPQGFDLESDLVADLATLEARNLKLKLADLSLSGDMAVGYAGEPEIRLSLATKRLDLDRLLQGGADTGAPASDQAETSVPEPAVVDEAAGSGGTSDKAAPFALALPSGLTVELNLVVDSLIYRGQVVRQALVDVKLAEGALELRQAIALLPGSSDLAVSGRLTTDQGRPHLKATLEAASGNLRALLDWLGTAVPEVPRSRLRKASLKTDIDFTPEQVMLSGLDLQIDVTRAVGGVAIALRQRPAFGIGLQVDKLNLDGYLRATTETVAAQSGEPQEEGLQGGSPGASQDPGAAKPASSTESSALLALLDGFDANMDLKVGSLVYQGRELRDLGLDATLQTGSLTVREARVGSFEGIRAGYRGQVAGLSGDIALDGSYEVAGEELGQLAKVIGMGQNLLAGKAGGLALSGSLKGSLTDLETDSSLKALGGEARLTGRIDALGQRFNLGFGIGHPNARKLLRAFGLGLKKRGLKGGLTLQGRLSGSTAAFAVEDLTGQAGDIKAVGRVALDSRGPRPLLALALDSPVFPLARLMKARTDGGGGGGLAPNLDRRWSRERIDLGFLREVDADFNLSSGLLLLEDLEIKAFQSEAALRNGILEIRKANGTIYDGALILSGQVNAQQRPQIALALTGIDLDLAQILAPARKGDAKELAKRVSGPVTVNARLNSQGDSEAALLSNLTGQGELQGLVTIRVNAEEQLGGLALSLLGNKVKQIKGIADSTTTLLGAFAGAPAQLNGSFVIDRGILRTRDTQLVGRSATALAAAQADLPGWWLDSTIDVYRAGERSKAFLTAKLKGPLDKPDVKIGGEPFQRDQVQPGTEDIINKGGNIDPGALLKGLLGD